MVVSGEQSDRWVIHDRDSIYSEGVDATLAAMELTIPKTTHAGFSSERILRAVDRQHASRVSGLAIC